jgi:hypothetical protein
MSSGEARQSPPIRTSGPGRPACHTWPVLALRSLASRPSRLAGVAATAFVLLVLLASTAPATAAARARPCSSYPVPGSLAPAGSAVPAGLKAKYALLRRRQRPIDRLRPGQLSPSLGAAGLIMSGTRFLGDSAFGGGIYLVPARHLLEYRLAPQRCMPPQQRALERALRPQLEREYRHAALCVEVVKISAVSCTAANGSPDALLYAAGTPGYGLVPDGVTRVTVTYQTAPARTIAVHRNFFEIIARSQSAPPCGVQWLDPSGTVMKAPVGCSYLAAETQALDQYRAYVAAKLSTLKSQLATLAAAIGAGNLAQAQAAWLAAHLSWLEIGQDDGAYGCFGQLGGDIDGLAAGHPQGTSDPGFTGFHRVEFDLFTNHDLRAAATDTATLQGLLAQLMKAPLSSYLPANATGIGAWVLRPHEVLEDALRDSLTADDDYGSGTDLASITADTAAVRELLQVLRPVLKPLAPHLIARAQGQLGALTGAIDATRTGGAWTPVEDLSTRQRQQVDADVDAALETLAPVPDLLTSTGRNAPTT